MDRATLAQKLILLKTRRERLRLLRQYAEITDARLADAVREICYSAWTVEPATARSSAAAIDCIASISPSPETEAIRSWVRGIADITLGRLEAATANLGEASAIFRANGDQRESAKPLVAMLIALAMLGRYDEAVKIAKRAIRIFERFDDNVEAGKIELNLSNIFSRQGLFRRAENYGLAALRRFQAEGEMTWCTMAENDLANTYTDQNKFRKAEQYYERALESAEAAGMLVTQAEIEASIGNLARFRGNYGDALRYLETSRRRYDVLSMPHQSSIADLEIAGIYLELNMLKEAAELYARAAGALRKLRIRGEEARARGDLGRTALAMGDVGLARRELARAARLYKAEGNLAGTATTLLTMATLDIESGQFQHAADRLSGIRKVTASRSRDRLLSDVLLARIDAAAGGTRHAERRLRKAIADARTNEQPVIEQTALGFLGKIAESGGRIALAEECYRKAIDVVETLRSPLPDDEFRIAFFAGKLEPYNELSKLLLAGERYGEAFECIEKARSRALADAMLEGSGSAAVPGELSDTAAKLREELNWYYRRVAEADAAYVTDLHLQIRQREKSLSDILRRIGSIGPTRRPVKDTSGLLASLQRELEPDRAFVEYFEIDGRVSAFVITQRDIRHFGDIASTDEIATLVRGLRFQFDSLRYGPHNLERFGELLKMRADLYLSKLYEKLLRPLEGSIAGHRLIIAPVSQLHYVPFHALRNGSSYVIEGRETVYVPSAAVWRRLSADAVGRRDNALLISYADEQIPNADGEAASLRGMFLQTKVLSGPKATFDAYRRHAPAFDVIHIACHGQFRPDDPAYSGLHLADGWITVKDVCSQHLKASLVTLSACETGVNEIAEGEELIGMARGFLTAGVGAIILTLWTVDDAESVALMKDLYNNLQRGKTISASLRSAQQKSIKMGKHPYFWSPFLLIGR